MEEHGHCETDEKHQICLAAFVFALGIFLPLLKEVKIALFLLAYLLAGRNVLFTALKNLFKLELFDENFLMSIATLGAFAIGEYQEAVMVMLLYRIGEYFQDRAVDKSRDSISELMDIRPDYANIEVNGNISRVNPQDVKIGDIIVVKTGEKIPLDGVVIEGQAFVDTSALTGESLPRKIQTDDEATSGCINTNGLIKIRVTKPFGESTVAKILQLVENAGSKKTKTENFITKFARVYTPIVVLGAIILAFVPPFIFGADFKVCLSRALTFLVISCPCALVISVPLSFFAGIGGASKKGILIKGSCFVEALSKPYAILFDKTGTLTKGEFKVTKIVPLGDSAESELLEYAAYAENFSNHPIATSLKQAYNKKIDANRISDVSEIAGNGVKIKLDGYSILAGNRKLMTSNGVQCDEATDFGTIVYVAKGSVYLGYIVISDEIKDDAKNAIAELKKYSTNLIMLTGDSCAAAEYTAKELNMTSFYSQLLPQQKVEKVEEIIKDKPKSSSVIFVGDGINDAPVLTRADIGIAMGALGSDAAIEAADVVIMDDKPSKIALGIKIASKTMTIVKQNIGFAIGVKIAFLALGAFGLMTMWGAVFADVGVTLLAVLNSMRGINGKV